ncbi:MAG: exodeoxyribonuclease VII large subunit [Leptolyngbyaceae cyanobacterium MO_188.B28]|nr:exodeoxyribonuclease VII large subunit [Leptolyngbyaceae cyanobacterium MO_188.B28]
MNLPASTSTPSFALSVEGLTDYIKALLEEDDQLRKVWVTGEISSGNQRSSGWFFTLQDPKDKASISCIVWRNLIPQLTTLPEVGEQVTVLGQIRLYAQRGSYQLVVWQILPAGEGLRALRLRQLRDRLAAEGLFAPEHKRPLPLYPQTLAVVTSAQAAAWGDIQRTLKQRHPGLRVLLSPAIVQGDQAAESIAQAIDRVVQDGRAELLILSRGGGAVEDLDCFNDERVVRAIALCPIPVVAGIGHQRDESLADLAADHCAHTPTAAAEQAIPSLVELYADHQGRAAMLLDRVSQSLLTAQDQTQQFRRRLQRLRLDRQIQQEVQSVDWLQQKLVQRVKQRFEQGTQQCQLLRHKLATLDPEAVLRHGYAVVRQEAGEIAYAASELTVGDRVQIQLGQGEVKAQIMEVMADEDKSNPDPPKRK